MTAPVDAPMMLEPCPFCGGDAAFEQLGTTRQSMIVACEYCGARHESGDVYGLTRDLWWNRRAAARAQAARPPVDREAVRQRYRPKPVSDAAKDRKKRAKRVARKVKADG